MTATRPIITEEPIDRSRAAAASRAFCASVKALTAHDAIRGHMERLHNEKLESHSRENERNGLCDCCGECPDECGRTEDACMEDVTEDWGERQFEARRDGYD